MRFGVCGAAPAAVELLTRFEVRYGSACRGVRAVRGNLRSHHNPVAGPQRAGTVGLPFPGQEIRIVDADGSEVPPDVEGEVVVRGPNVMRGYLGRPEETAKVIVDGWLHTGDVGRLDADGYLTLVGRSKDMIIHGGGTSTPRRSRTFSSVTRLCSRPP
ncbi:AMP-binding protein [Streptomyces cynarae]|uniref:AMP-binding protein n=1 Tax=Streptomyces cynarae TaxID=2981134 RepID=UPI00406C83DE